MVEIKVEKKLNLSGDYSGGETPETIPNSEVKPSCANGTAELPLWESRTLPEFN